MSDYNTELATKKKKVAAELKAHEELLKLQVFDSKEWWEMHKKVNSLKIDLKTASDRLYYLGKPMGIEPVKLIDNK